MPDLVQSAPADDRSSMLAELRSIERGAPAADPPPVADPPPKADVTDQEDSPSDPPSGEVSDPDQEDEDDDSPADPPAPAAKVDPETARRLSQVQKQEKRAREGLAADRREFEEERTRWREENREKVSSVERFEKMKERARVDLASVARELGIPDEDFEYHAEQMYRRSPKGMKDPRHKAMAEQSLREREQVERIARLEKQLEDDKKSRTDAETRAEQKRAADDYMVKVSKAVGDETPIVRGMLKKNPERARQRLSQVALEMSRAIEDIPDPAEVVKALESDLREWGLTPPSSGGTNGASTPATKAGGPKSKNPGAGEQKRPQPKQASSPAPADPEQQRKEIVQALKEGSFSDE